MSRSHKKTPIFSACGYKTGAMKKWKTHVNRLIRRVPIDQELGNYSYVRRINDIWGSPSDGKMWRRVVEDRDWRK